MAVGFSPNLARLSDLAPLASGFYRLALAVPAIWLAIILTGSEIAARILANWDFYVRHEFAKVTTIIERARVDD